MAEGNHKNTGLAAQLSGQGALIALLCREAVILTDSSGAITFWNPGAESLYGWREDEALGKSPIELLKTELPRTLAQIENILRREERWDYELKQTSREGKHLTVSSRWALLRDERGEPVGRLQLDRDLTRRRKAERDLRTMSGRLLNLRDEERRRLARDLHDSVGQLLALTKVNLSVARRHLTDSEAEARRLFAESCEMIEQALSEVRTISYLLHPPLLEEMGLSSVLSWFVSGFSERSGIQVDLKLPEKMGRFSHELETAIFRIIQECLTNVHRHSRGSAATIELARSKDQLRLRIEDNGAGFSAAGSRDGREGSLPGVGLSGIRERVRQLGGEMQIQSGDRGTAIEVEFPVAGHLLAAESPEVGPTVDR